MNTPIIQLKPINTEETQEASKSEAMPFGHTLLSSGMSVFVLLALFTLVFSSTLYLVQKGQKGAFAQESPNGSMASAGGPANLDTMLVEERVKTKIYK